MNPSLSYVGLFPLTAVKTEFSSYSAMVFFQGYQVFAQRLSESFVLFTPFSRGISKVGEIVFMWLQHLVVYL